MWKVVDARYAQIVAAFSPVVSATTDSSWCWGTRHSILCPLRHCALTFVFFASGNSDGKSLSECTIFSLYLYLQQGQLRMIYPTWCKYQQSDQSLGQEQVEDLFSLASDSVASSEAAVRRGLALARNFRSRHIKYERAMGVSIYKHFDWQHPLPKDRLFLFWLSAQSMCSPPSAGPLSLWSSSALPVAKLNNCYLSLNSWHLFTFPWPLVTISYVQTKRPTRRASVTTVWCCSNGGSFARILTHHHQLFDCLQVQLIY